MSTPVTAPKLLPKCAPPALKLSVMKRKLPEQTSHPVPAHCVTRIGVCSHPWLPWLCVRRFFFHSLAGLFCKRPSRLYTDQRNDRCSDYHLRQKQLSPRSIVPHKTRTKRRHKK